MRHKNAYKLTRAAMLLLAALFSLTGTRAETLTVSDGTDTENNIPFHSYYADWGTRSQFIVPATELSAMISGTITGLTLYSTSASSLSYDEGFTVYMTEVDYSTFSSAAYVDWDSMTDVYTGTIGVSSEGLMEIVFDTPYIYEGGNLLIGFQVTTWGTSCPNINWYGVKQTEYTAVYNHANGSNHDWGNTPYRAQFIPKTTFTYTPGNGVSLPSTLEVSGVTAYKATLTWTGGTGTYNVGYKKTVDEDWTAAATGTTETTLELTGLTQSTAYQARVQSVGEDNLTSVWRRVSFTTQVSCPAPTDLAVTLTPGDGTMATLDWTENGEATAWQICLNDDEDNLIETDNNSYTFTGLTPEATYTAKVRAVGVGEYSLWSDNVSFQPSDKFLVGSGTITSSYLPTYIYYNNSLSQQIYTVQELGDESGYILSIDFYCTQDNQYERDFYIYMVSTDKEEFASANDWIPVTEDDLVYSGSVTLINGWNNFEFDTPFAYDGGSNVALIVKARATEYENGPGFYVYNTDANQAIRIYSDGTDYDPTNPGSYTGTLMSQKNCLRIEKSDAPIFPKPKNLAVNDVTSSTATLSWTGLCDEYNVLLAVGKSTNLLSADFEDQAIPDDFTNDTTYPWTIIEGDNGYFIQSSNDDVASSTSSISVTKTFGYDGTIEFDAECMGEGTNTAWDKCIFSIDGEAKFTYGSNDTGWNHYSFPVTTGEHTFTWSYTKDSSVNPEGDYFAIDNVVINSNNITWADAPVVVTDTEEATLTGLTPNTMYYVKVVGIIEGNNYESVPATFTTLSFIDIELADNADNSTIINNNNGETAIVVLMGRTLYKDGDWNTLCLPFDVTVAESPLAGATIMELDNSSSTITDGVLTLSFKTATNIEAGKPYFIKWASGVNLTENDLMFTGVIISKDIVPVAIDGVITFTGSYAPISFTDDAPSILYLGSGSKLYYPKAGFTLNAFRTHFELADGYTMGDLPNPIKAFVLDFGDNDDPTGIVSPLGETEEGAAIYNLAGQRLNKTQKGINIVNGKKVMVK